MKTLSILFLTCSCLVSAFAQSTVPPPWSDIQLTGVVAKVPIVFTPRGDGVPLWVPIAGGALVTGGGLYWLLREDDPPPGPAPCDPTADITTTPANCDNANGTAAITIEPAGDYTVTWPDGVVATSRTELAPGGYTITVTRAGSDCTASFAVLIDNAPVAFELSVTGTDTPCGEAEGSATAIVTGSGEYGYVWSDGVTGATRTKLAAGDYSVTATDAATGCFTVGKVTIGTLPPTYIQDFTQVQPGCTTPAAVDFGLESPSGSPLTVTLTTPEATHTLELAPGPVALAEWVDLLPGDYQLRVQTTADCVDTRSFHVEAPPVPPQIELGEVQAPSGPSAADGALTLFVAVASTPPYTIVLNGEAVGTFEGAEATLSGLGWGSHQVRVRSAAGCLSNPLEVVFEQVQPGWTVGAAMGGPGGGPPLGRGTVEHPAPGGSGTFQVPEIRPGLRATRCGTRHRAVLTIWPGATAWTAAFVPQWSGGNTALRWHTGPGIWWSSGTELASDPIDWRWTGGLDIGLPQNRAGRIGIEASYGPGGRCLGLVLEW